MAMLFLARDTRMALPGRDVAILVRPPEDRKEERVVRSPSWWQASE